jgi:hypothetical protein
MAIDHAPFGRQKLVKALIAELLNAFAKEHHTTPAIARISCQDAHLWQYLVLVAN